MYHFTRRPHASESIFPNDGIPLRDTYRYDAASEPPSLNKPAIQPYRCRPLVVPPGKLTRFLGDSGVEASEQTT